MTLIDRDLGTPAPDRAQRTPAPTTVEVTIDGQVISVAEGTSVMRAAALAGVDVPKLCATDRLDAFGSCRLCVVEIDGRTGTPASCTTPCTPGMNVTTQSPKLERVRRDCRCRFFEAGGQAKQLRAFLREGNVVLGLMADVGAGPRGRAVPLFDQPASTSPARLGSLAGITC